MSRVADPARKARRRAAQRSKAKWSETAPGN